MRTLTKILLGIGTIIAFTGGCKDRDTQVTSNSKKINSRPHFNSYSLDLPSVLANDSINGICNSTIKGKVGASDPEGLGVFYEIETDSQKISQLSINRDTGAFTFYIDCAGSTTDPNNLGKIKFCAYDDDTLQTDKYMYTGDTRCREVEIPVVGWYNLPEPPVDDDDSGDDDGGDDGGGDNVDPPVACVETDWSSSDSVCQSDDTLTRTWTKTGTCEGGINHEATESISCDYVDPPEDPIPSITSVDVDLPTTKDGDTITDMCGSMVTGRSNVSYLGGDLVTNDISADTPISVYDTIIDGAGYFSFNLDCGASTDATNDLGFVVLKASAENGFDEKTLNIIGLYEPPNLPPEVSSIPSAEIKEGADYSYQVEGTDPEGVSLIYSLTNNPVWMSIDSNTGLISGTSPGVSEDTYYTAKVNVSDGENTTVRDLSVLVKNNLAPELFSHPAVVEIPKTSFYNSQAFATDPNIGDVLTYFLSATTITAYPWLSINSTTGEISGTLGNGLKSGDIINIEWGATDGEYSPTWTYDVLVTK